MCASTSVIFGVVRLRSNPAICELGQKLTGSEGKLTTSARALIIPSRCWSLSVFWRNCSDERFHADLRIGGRAINVYSFQTFGKRNKTLAGNYTPRSEKEYGSYLAGSLETASCFSRTNPG